MWNLEDTTRSTPLMCVCVCWKSRRSSLVLVIFSSKLLNALHSPSVRLHPCRPSHFLWMGGTAVSRKVGSGELMLGVQADERGWPEQVDGGFDVFQDQISIHLQLSAEVTEADCVAFWGLRGFKQAGITGWRFKESCGNADLDQTSSTLGGDLINTSESNWLAHLCST